MVREHGQSIPHLGGEFTGMVCMDAHPEGMMLLKDPAKFRGDALRQEDRNAGSNPDKLNMRDGPELGEQRIELVIGKEERIAS